MNIPNALRQIIQISTGLNEISNQEHTRKNSVTTLKSEIDILLEKLKKTVIVLNE